MARSLRSLQHSPQLVALEVNLTGLQIQALVELRKALASCPNLRKLQISNSAGREVPRQHVSLCVPGWQLPPLKYLRLQQAMLADYENDGWERCMDWKTLEHLSCHDIRFIPVISTSLQQLRSLEVHLSKHSVFTSEQFHALFEFVKTSSKLERLCIIGALKTLRSHNFWERTCSSLRHVEIRQSHAWGTIDAGELPYVLSSREIADMGRLWPRLQSCSIDLEVRSEWVRPLPFILRRFSILVLKNP